MPLYAMLARELFGRRAVGTVFGAVAEAFVFTARPAARGTQKSNPLHEAAGAVYAP